jgi:class 3 adenylate cyclase
MKWISSVQFSKWIGRGLEMQPQTADKTTAKKARRNLSDKIRWALILTEFTFIYLLILVSIYLDWPYHNTLRFLVMIPMYHAGAAFGYNGGILASLLSLFLFIPLIPVDTPNSQIHFTFASSILLLALYVSFGIIVGGTVGEARKTRGYVDILSKVFMGIFGEPDERSVMLRSCIEAASLTEAAGGAVLVRPDGKHNISDWPLIGAFGNEEHGEATTVPSPDNVLVWCARRNSAFVTNSVVHDARLTVGAPAAQVRSIMAVPVSFEQTVYGAFILMDRKNGENFSEKELSIAKMIAETAGGAIHNMAQEKERQEEKLREEQMRSLFSRYVSSSIADYVLEHPGLLAGRWQEVTVLVSDIRSFTALSEKITAHALVAQLNEYFTAMVDVIFENKGTIDKFIGDCVIAYWGAPAPDPAHAANAIRAASAMSRALDRLNASWAARGMTPLSAGIAIHTCSVLMGNLGDDRKKVFTIMGEEVEKVIKMESITKTIGAKIIVSETAASASGARLEILPDAPAEFGRLFSCHTE